MSTPTDPPPKDSIAPDSERERGCSAMPGSGCVVRCSACGKNMQRQRKRKISKCRDCKQAENSALRKIRGHLWKKKPRKTLLPNDLQSVRRKNALANLKFTQRTEEKEAKRTAAVKSSNKIKTHMREMRLSRKHEVARLEGVQKSALTGPYETNKSAERWKLRSPNRGEIFEFTNLSHFLRNHSDLFDPEDLVARKGGMCRAYGGLKSLSPRRTKTNGSWKGWQWVSDEERHLGNNDLLGQTSAASPNDELCRPREAKKSHE